MNDAADQQTPSLDIFSPDFVLANVGAPFLIGAAVGYFAKKMLRVVLFCAGALIVLAFAGEYFGIISINDVQMQSAAQTVANDAKGAGGFLVDRLTLITSKGVSSVAGFFVGFRLG